MKFKRGDRVICINAEPSSYLTYGKMYTVTRNSMNRDDFIFINATIMMSFNSSLFISFDEYRLIKINKIKERCSKEEI